MSATKYPFTPEMEEEFKRLYPTMTCADLAHYFGCNIRKIHNLQNKLGVKKDKSFIAEVSRKNTMKPGHGGVKTQFKKGRTPDNFGKKQFEYMSPEAIERSKATRFQKGHAGTNTKPVGSEVLRADGYIWVKTGEPNKWKQKHRIVWEANHGKIRRGYNIQFRDKNRLNCEIDNLYIISRSEQLKKENSMYAKYPKEMQLAIQTKGALTRQINKLKKSTK